MKSRVHRALELVCVECGDEVNSVGVGASAGVCLDCEIELRRGDSESANEEEEEWS